MSAKHTPGPWTVGPVTEGHNEGPHALWVNAPNGDPDMGYTEWRGLAEVYGCDYDPTKGDGRMRANASLIAAAPDLLAALKAASGELALHKDSPLRLQIDAAIAKAEGAE